MQINFGPVNMEAGFGMPLPRLIPVRQRFEAPSIDSKKISAVLQSQFANQEIAEKIKPGMRIAVGVGSRGIENLQEIVRCTIQELKGKGAQPFIVPAMGSHGGGMAEAQAGILAEYGITEEQVGAPIRASMDTVHLGTVMGDVEVYIDRMAATEADGVVVVSRIKPHTDFKGPIESGICKMLGIGLGKHKGASYLHRGTMKNFAQLIPTVGRFIAEKTNLLFGVGIVENAYHQTAILELVPREKLVERETELLATAKKYMARILFPEVDVLVVEEMGKNISGSGMDSNIVGRSSCHPCLQFEGTPKISKISVLRLTHETNGNASGIGMADFTTQRLVETIDFPVLYANAITAVEIGGGKLPIVMQNDREAIEIAIRTAGQRNLSNVRVCRIKNTLALDEIWVSENLLQQVTNPNISVAGEPVEWKFDASGHLIH
jgi:hypothetical protein